MARTMPRATPLLLLLLALAAAQAHAHAEAHAEARKDESVVGWIASVAVAQAAGLPAMPAWCSSAARAVLPPAQDAVLMRWPYVTSAAGAEAEVLFGVHGTLPRPAAAAVEWWTEAATEARAVAVDAAYTLRAWTGWPIPTNTTMHQYAARLANLTEDAEICYRVRVDGVEIVGGLRFRTAPARGSNGGSRGTVRFVAVGDFGVASMDQGRVANALWARLNDADFAVILGDNTYFDGKGHEYHKRTFPYYAAQWASKAVVPVSGNHDMNLAIGDSTASEYLKNFRGLAQPEVVPEHQGRYFSFDWGHVHFVVLDTEWTRFDTARHMNAWLRADLAANADQPWRVILLHKPPYVGAGIADTAVYNELRPIWEEGSAQVVLGGHWHQYSRYPSVRDDVPVPVAQGGTLYITSGGGGYAVSKSGEYVELPDGRIVLDRTREQAHHASIVETNGATPIPDVTLAVHHYVAWTFGDCEATMETINVNRTVVDTVTINRCV